MDTIEQRERAAGADERVQREPQIGGHRARVSLVVAGGVGADLFGGEHEGSVVEGLHRQREVPAQFVDAEGRQLLRPELLVSQRGPTSTGRSEAGTRWNSGKGLRVTVGDTRRRLPFAEDGFAAACSLALAAVAVRGRLARWSS